MANPAVNNEQRLAAFKMAIGKQVEKATLYSQNYFISHPTRNLSSADANNGGKYHRIRDGHSHARDQGGDQSSESGADRTVRGRGVHFVKLVPDLDESGENW